MDQGVIDPQRLFLTRAGNKENIMLMPTPHGGSIEDAGCIKFNNAIERMSKPRIVDHVEIDVEFVFRNKVGSVYAVVYHNEMGEVITDMLTRAKNGEWKFNNFNIRFYTYFTSAYISSIYGYKQLSESQIAQELSCFFAFEGIKAVIGDYAMLALPGGIALARSVFRDEEIVSVELFDFVTYESFDRDEIKDTYYQELHRYVSGEIMNTSNFPEDLLRRTINDGVERIKKKFNKDKDNGK